MCLIPALGPLPCQLLEPRRDVSSSNPLPIEWAGRNKISHVQAKPVSSHNYLVSIPVPLGQTCVSPHSFMWPDCVASRASSKTTRCHPGCVAQLEHCPVHQKAAGSIPCQGINSGCRFGPKLGHVWEVTNQPIDVSLSLPLSLKKSINKNTRCLGFC